MDAGYTGEQAAEDAASQGIRLAVVKLSDAKPGFILLPKRWVVERSIAWLVRFRRLARDYERFTLKGLHFLAFACLMLKNVVVLFNQLSAWYVHDRLYVIFFNIVVLTTILVLFIAANRDKLAAVAFNFVTATAYETQAKIPKLQDIFPTVNINSSLEHELALLPTETLVKTATPTSIPTQTLTNTPAPTMTQTQKPFTRTPIPIPTRIPIVKILASSVIVRQSPGNRIQKVTELKTGTVVSIIGFAIYESEQTLWWKISSNDTIVGWVVHNPKLVELYDVKFNGDIPVNIDEIRP